MRKFAPLENFLLYDTFDKDVLQFELGRDPSLGVSQVDVVQIVRGVTGLDHPRVRHIQGQSQKGRQG